MVLKCIIYLFNKHIKCYDSFSGGKEKNNSKSHFWEYCPGRFYPADNTGSKSRLPTLGAGANSSVNISILS